PNVVKGGSHSGNLSAVELARAGLLDVLASDYVPVSLLAAVLRLAEPDIGVALPEAVKMASLNAARAAGLEDRGAIAPGHRADLIRVRMVAGQPVVRTVYAAGERVA
ncbi:MAG TPA: amidohydrolase family protein, partial [Kiloniellaceae bacterium]|nr:amidohydrolase family protein [Kiloniellaceae bacterium]